MPEVADSVSSQCAHHSLWHSQPQNPLALAQAQRAPSVGARANPGGKRISMAMTTQGSGGVNASSRSSVFHDAVLPPAASLRGRMSQCGADGPGSEAKGAHHLDAANFQRARAEAMGLARGPSMAQSPSGGAAGGFPTLPSARNAPAGRVNSQSLSGQMSNSSYSLPPSLLDKSRSASVPPQRESRPDARTQGSGGTLPDIRPRGGSIDHDGGARGNGHGAGGEKKGFMRLFGRGGKGAESPQAEAALPSPGTRDSDGSDGAQAKDRNGKGLLQRIFHNGPRDGEPQDQSPAKARAGDGAGSGPKQPPGTARGLPGAPGATLQPATSTPRAPPAGFRQRMLI